MTPVSATNARPERIPPKGFPIVLTADRVLMADYRILLDGMFAAAQTTSTPEPVMRSFVSTPMPAVGVRAEKAPLGLRRLEAALLRAGHSREDVAIVPPERLTAAIGASTRLVLVSSGDPLGLGMNNSTMSAIVGGDPYTRVWFERMLLRLRGLKRKFSNVTVIAGGPGAWQLEQNDEERQRLGIDLVFSGYAEEALAQLVTNVLEGKPMDAVFSAGRVRAESVPEVLGPTSMGVVEISRGCGLGCGFCTLRSEPMAHLSLDRIVHDVQTNVRAGVTSICLVSEDLLRYGADGAKPSPCRLIDMLHAVRRVEGLRLIQTDHVNVSSAAQFPEGDLREVRHVMTGGVRHDYLWVNVGVESASGKLLKANGCAGKVRPFGIEEWAKVCRQAILRLIDAGFIPMVSLVFGLPGEDEDDVRQTLALVEELQGARVMIFPLFFAPIKKGQKPFGLADMTPLHWRLFRLSYRLNFKWLPKVYWDNQRGAGVSLARRLLMQGAGQLNSLGWRLRFIWKSGRLFP
ncbi:MAG: B12-binding domain-containing radical SAM protein [Planctomycetes bacterium]|nr:B12-binding domain-containing radical SAM protein [Planctomycetota bacterium]